MSKSEGKTNINRLAFLFAVTYMISYMTRINYGAIISEMESETKISRSLLSMALTGSFITYGVGQIVSGIIGDRFSPKRLITCGLLVTTVMNLLIPLSQNAYFMLTVWCINGFAQSLMWPPMVRMMTELLSEDDYKRTAAKVSWGSNCGTIAVYLISPLLITLLGWKSVFVFSAVCGAVMMIFWNKFSPDTKITCTSSPSEKTKTYFISPIMLCIAAAIILQGMLRDGVTTWMPSYISETYNLSSSLSILTGVILPVFGILCIQAATKLYITKLKNPLVCAGAFFGLGAVSAFTLYWLTGINATVSVLFSAILTGCMHGVNLILICMIPPFFKSRGNVSTVSGVLNSCTYIGSAVSTYGIAVLSENVGWSFTLLIWLIIAAVGAVLCFASAKPWIKYNRSR